MVKQKHAKLLRPPIVTILGHVDHGKTTLLDTIRKTNVAQKEFGGITQHIGAYQVEVQNNKITFIDTPGHEAFAKMRGKGANVADIAVLVVAGNDGIMPQTKESLAHIKEAKVPFIVALNKIDLPDIKIDKVKKQLQKEGVNLEEYGGEVPLIPLSAKTGQNIDKLLEMIIFLADYSQIKEDEPGKFKAVVIESTLSKNKGTTATVVARSGKILQGEEIVCENQIFKIRAIFNWKGQSLPSLSAGDPAEILGWKTIPSVGSYIYAKNQTEIMPSPNMTLSTPQAKKLTLPSQTGIEEEKIKIILKADTLGTLEAIKEGVTKNAEIIYSNVGNINESDILLAKSTQSIIIGFNTNLDDRIIKLAAAEKVIIKTYNIIYELFDELNEVMELLKKGDLVNVYGEAKVIALFKIKDETVAGIKVISGRIAKGDLIKLVRNNQEITRTRIKSLKFHKDDITKAEQGNEAGVLFSQQIDLLTGDSIISIG